jgi:hypothetical protein
VIPADLKLNPRIVAYWFLDDGCNSPKKRTARFSTDGFSEDGVELLITKLGDLHIKATKQKAGKHHIIAISCTDYFRFIEMIRPFVGMKCMKHKVDVSTATKQREGWGTGKLSYRKARQIRTLYATDKYEQAELAQIFGVSLGSIWKVLNHKTYPEANVGLRGTVDVKVTFQY